MTSSSSSSSSSSTASLSDLYLGLLDICNGIKISSSDNEYLLRISPQYSLLSEEVKLHITDILPLIASSCKLPKSNTTQFDRHCEDLMDDISSNRSSNGQGGSKATYDLLVEMIDILLSNADMYIDKMSKDTNANTIMSLISPVGSNKGYQLMTNVLDMKKPQTLFTDIDNSRHTPFVPLVKSKAHNHIPLSLKKIHYQPDDELVEDAIAPSYYYEHPYTVELHNIQYPQWMLSDPNSQKPWMPSPEQPFEFIDTIDGFAQFKEELEGVDHIAIDLEHHSQRSFQGITCLMQVSTRQKDYVIDCIKLRSHMHMLEPIFANPGVLKVFHGCESDILWLQRDFGLYIVNCFDTYCAAKILEYQALSLAHLLKVHCSIKLNKKFQLADWRQRPLSSDMILYAKNDTHYLLYIFDVLRLKLWQQSNSSKGMKSALEHSRHICMKRYEKPFFYVTGYKKIIADIKASSTSSSTSSSSSSSSSSKLNDEQEAALAALWNWRDMTARVHDESAAYVMSNADMLSISMNVPRTLNELHTCVTLSEMSSTFAADIISCINDAFSIVPATAAAPTGNISKSVEAYAAMTEDDATLTNSVGNSSRLLPYKVSVQSLNGASDLLPYRIHEYDTILSFIPTIATTTAATATAKTQSVDRAKGSKKSYTISSVLCSVQPIVAVSKSCTSKKNIDRLSSIHARIVEQFDTKSTTTTATTTSTTSTVATATSATDSDAEDEGMEVDVQVIPSNITNAPANSQYHFPADAIPQAMSEKYSISTHRKTSDQSIKDKKRKQAGSGDSSISGADSHKQSSETIKRDNTTTTSSSSFDYSSQGSSKIGAMVTADAALASSTQSKYNNNNSSSSRVANPYIRKTTHTQAGVVKEEVERRNTNKKSVYSSSK